MYSRESVAYERSQNLTIVKPGPRHVKRVAKTAKTSTRSRANVMTLRKQKVVLMVLVLSAMAFLLQYRYAMISKEFQDLSARKARHESISSQVVQKEMELEGSIDLKRVDEEAVRLGMQKPSKSQIRYLSLGNPDSGVVLKEDSGSAIQAFVNNVAAFLEYLY